jgi:FkbM family methyltransferase
VNFNLLAMSLIEERIRKHPSIEEILGQIIKAAQTGFIAFYPCSRCTNELVKLLQQISPQTLTKVVGVFDNSPNAFAEAGMDVYPLAELNRVQPAPAVLVVAANVFYARETESVTRLIGSETRIINVSGIDLELSGTGREGLTAQIREVVELLADEKSRAVYLLAWLSRLLNDENLTELFADDGADEVSLVNGSATFYKNYRLDNLPPEIVRELDADIYSLKSVAAGSGDTVLDVGAFKGDTAVYFADMVGESGRVFSFEPVKANFIDLVHNVRQNRLENIVVPINKGCGRTSGSRSIATAPQGSPWAFFSEDRGVEHIDVTTIDDFVAGEKLKGVDFIKLDVEGMEREVIIGAEQTIALFRPKMAVSLYHKLLDLTELPLLLNAMASYNMYVRCKMAGPWSIFLYCEPKI